VAEFRTPAGARYEVASEAGYFLTFNEGRFQYEISFEGSLWAIHQHGPAIKAQTIAAAQALHSRVDER